MHCDPLLPQIAGSSPIQLPPLPPPVPRIHAQSIAFCFDGNSPGSCLDSCGGKGGATDVDSALLAIEKALAILNPCLIKGAGDCSWIKVKDGKIAVVSPLEALQCLGPAAPGDSVINNGSQWIVGQIPVAIDCLNISPLLDPDSPSTCYPRKADEATDFLSVGPSGIGYRKLIDIDVIPAITNVITLDSATGLTSTVSGVVSKQPIPVVAGIDGSVEQEQIVSDLGFDLSGRLVQNKRRPLLREMYSGQAAGVASTAPVSTIAAPAGRLVALWIPTVVGQEPQQPMGLTYDGAGKFAFGHKGWYSIKASTFCRFQMSASEDIAGRGWSILSAFVVDQTSVGGSLYETRFGENSIQSDPVYASNAVLFGSGYDVVHTGVIEPLWMGPGAKIWVRSWVTGVNAASSRAVATFSQFNAGMVFGAVELQPNTF